MIFFKITEHRKLTHLGVKAMLCCTGLSEMVGKEINEVKEEQVASLVRDRMEF